MCHETFALQKRCWAGVFGLGSLSVRALSECQHPAVELLLPCLGRLRHLSIDGINHDPCTLSYILDVTPPVLECPAHSTTSQIGYLLHDAVHFVDQLRHTRDVCHAHLHALSGHSTLLVELLLHCVQLGLQCYSLLLLSLPLSQFLAASLHSQLRITHSGHKSGCSNTVAISIFGGLQYFLSISLPLPSHIDWLDNPIETLGNAAPCLLLQGLKRCQRSL
mmetsp:Transcript_128747/g.257150  ORF Transcript_128747/g.257150 Transcript_128747/m.257150 type:complete len:220 (+) Transcript_128747:279-938(+)